MNTEQIATTISPTKSSQLQTIFVIVLISVAPVLIVILPWDFGSGMNPFKALIKGNGLSVTLVECLVILLAIANGTRPMSAFSHIHLFAKIAIFVVASIALLTASFVAVHKDVAYISFYMWLIHMLFAFSFWSLLRFDVVASMSVFWIGIAIGIVFYLGILIPFVASVENPENFEWAIGIPGLPNIRSLGFFSVAGFAAGAGLTFSSQRRDYFYWGMMLAGVAVGLAIWSATRGALVAILVAAVIGGLRVPQIRRKVFGAWMAGVVALGLLGSHIAYKPNEHFGISRVVGAFANSEGSVDRMSAGRVAIWYDTIEYIKERPFLGYGQRQFRTEGPLRSRGLNQPHNIFLQIAFQWGILGAVLFFGLLAYLLWHIWRRSSGLKMIGLGEYFLVTSVLTYSLYDAALFYPYPIMMFICGVTIALAQVNQRAVESDRSD